METSNAIFWTQIPIALAILVGAVELYRTRKELMKLLEKLASMKTKE